MRRWFILGLVMLALIIGLAGSIYWLMGTTGGTRWLLGAISRWTPVKLEARKISGQMGHELKIEGLRVYWSKGEMNVDGFHIHWQPLHLLMGKAIIEKLTFHGVQIQDDRPKRQKVIELKWPRLPGIIYWIHGGIRLLHIDRLRYRHLDQPPFIMEKLSSRLDWRHGLLTLEEMAIEIHSGSVKGAMELGLLRPGLYLNLNISPSEPILGLDSLRLNSRLLPARSPEQVTGHLLIEGISQSVKQLLIESEIGITPKAVTFQKLLLSRPNRRGTLIGDGSITFTENDFLMNLKMQFSGLDFSQELAIKTAFSGTLHVEGNPNDYRGNIRIENTKEEWYSGYLSGHFSGTLKGVRWTLLDGSILDGNVQGHLNAQWEEGFSLKGTLQATNLNPAGITPDWDGKINLNLEGAFRLPKGKFPEGRLKAHLPESHLRGHQLTGDIELYLENSILRLARTNLRGKGFDLVASGIVQEKVAFKTDISDLSGLVPDTRGNLLASGWFRWRKGLLTMAFHSQGKDLFIKEVGLGGLALSARFDGGQDAQVELKGDFRKVAYKSLKFHSATLNVKGKLAHHKILFTMRLPEGNGVNGSVEGSYSKEVWQGTILHLTGSEQRGSWRLEAPASLLLSSRQIALESFSITSSYGERVQLSADLMLRPLRGTLQAQWHQFDPARINPWLGKRRLTGRTTGGLHIQWLEEDRLRMAATANLTGTFTDPSLKAEVSQGFVKFDWNEKGLQALGEFEFVTGGKFRANLSSLQPARMALPQQAKLDARWESIDLSLFRPWLPQTVAFDGRFLGRLSGQWLHGSRFDHTGELKASGGTLKWRNKQGQITTGLQTLDLNWIWHDETLRGRLSLVLEDYGNLKGNFHLPVAPRLPMVIRHDGPVRLSLQGQLRDKGLLTAFFPDFIQESRGQMDLNLEAGGTWKKPHLQGLLKLKETEVYLPVGKTRLPTAKNNISEALLKLELSQGLMKFNWDEKELLWTWDFDFANHGKVQGNISSSLSARMAFPERGTVEARWQAIDLNLLKPWLSEQLVLEGSFMGRLSGQWSKAQFDTTGEMKMTRGAVCWQHEDGLIRASVQTADVNWVWRDELLRGELSLVLAEYGHVKGNFQLPFIARLPVAAQTSGPMRLSLQGQFQEKGLLPAFLPGLVQESRGQVHVNLTGDGTWQNPRFEGNVKLEKAEGYLPTVGIRLKDLDMEARLMGDQIQVNSFRTRSGPGHIEGAATVWLQNWKVSRYQGSLKGDHFQTIYFPELQVQSTPDLNFQGTTEKLSVRGEIRLPEISIFSPHTREAVRPSPDVIVVDRPEAPKKGLPVAVDIQVRLLLGEKVFVKAEGIEARLTGSVGLTVQEPIQVNADGEIRVAEGHYNAYGQKLEITRGRLIFTRAPIDNPALDALAVRKIREVQAGVVVAGTLKSPVVRLYSRPSMADTDILSYIILGQPLGTGKEQAPSLMQAAAGLLSAGESVVLQGQLKKRLGLDVLDIQAGGDEISRSMVTIGKYLTPKLYISLGRSLFTEATFVTLRYTLSKRLEIETQAGTESGASLYYRIEFK
jgi:translocation and assembly module TamB